MSGQKKSLLIFFKHMVAFHEFANKADKTRPDTLVAKLSATIYLRMNIFTLVFTLALPIQFDRP